MRSYPPAGRANPWAMSTRGNAPPAGSVPGWPGRPLAGKWTIVWRTLCRLVSAKSRRTVPTAKRGVPSPAAVCAAGGVVVTVDPEPLVGAAVEPVGPGAAGAWRGRDEGPLSSYPRRLEHDATVMRAGMAVSTETA